MSAQAPPTEHQIESGEVVLSASESGDGPPVVLLHGLTATRRYVVMGSRVLDRAGHRVVTFDARGHGVSTPAPTSQAYGYEHMAADLEAVLDAMGIERATIAGASMGAHTAVRFALHRPDRVAGLVLITPAYDPVTFGARAALVRWDHLSQGLRDGGVDGFVAAYAQYGLPDKWRETILTVLRQRLSLHMHPDAVADALRCVPRSRPFETMAELRRIEVPTVVVASRDEADPEHPLSVASGYAAAIPGATLAVEAEGESPIAWQGAQVSQLIARAAAAATGADPASTG